MIKRPPHHGRHTAATSLAISLAALLVITWPAGGAAGDRCPAPTALAALDAPLPRITEHLRSGKSLTIVALGSSSTAGTGATRPDLSYPSRLAVLLQARLPGLPIRVVNRGVCGETAANMAARIDRDVLAEHPDLVIWQVGTTGVLRGEDPHVEAEVVRRGIERLKAEGVDVLLMDLQYAPEVLAHPQYRDMLQVISTVAHDEQVPVFRRFAVMKHWTEEDGMPLSVMVSVDKLHMTDLSYDCLAGTLAEVLVASSRAGR